MNPYSPSAACVQAPEDFSRPPLQVRFQNTLLDLFRFQLYCQPRSPVLLFIFLVFVGVVASTTWGGTEPARMLATLIITGLSLAAMVVLQVLVTFAWILVNRDKTYWHPRTLAFRHLVA